MSDYDSWNFRDTGTDGPATLVPWHRTVARTVSCPFEDMSAMEQRIAAAGLTVIDRTYNDTGVVISVEGPEDAVACVVSGN